MATETVGWISMIAFAMVILYLIGRILIKGESIQDWLVSSVKIKWRGKIIKIPVVSIVFKILGLSSFIEAFLHNDPYHAFLGFNTFIFFLFLKK